MSISKSLTADKKIATIQVHNKFDLGIFRDFREAYTDAELPLEGFIVDLEYTNYISSSGLGALLHLLDLCNSQKLTLNIINVKNSQVISSLKSVNFNKLFNIEGLSD